MTFNAWLRRQRRRDDPVGDLARDAAEAVDKPRGRVTLGAWRRYLQRRGAVEGALRALERAWAEYEEAQG